MALRGALSACVLFMLGSGVLTLVTGARGPGLQWVQYAHGLMGVITAPLLIVYVVVHVSQILRNPARVAWRAALAATAVFLFIVMGPRIGLEGNERLSRVLSLFVLVIVLRLSWILVKVLRERRSPWAVGSLFFMCSVLAVLSGILVIPGGSSARGFYRVHVASIPFAVGAGIAHVLLSRRSAARGAFPWAAPLRRITLPSFVVVSGIVATLAVVVQLSARVPDVAERAISATDEGFLEVSSEVCKTCHLTAVRTWEQSAHARAASNPVFIALLRSAMAEGRGTEARRCLMCHAPHAADPTRFSADEVVASEGFQAGVHCVSCHRMADPPGLRDGAAEFKPFANEPATFLVERSGGISRWLRSQRYAAVSTVEARMGRHLTQWRAPGRPLGCRPCHIQSLEPMTHGRLTQVLQDQYESWKESPAATSGRDCTRCHMRLVYGREGYVVTDHRFAAASTYVGRVAGGEAGERATIGFLEARWVPPEGSVSLESAGVSDVDQLTHGYIAAPVDSSGATEPVRLLEMNVRLVQDSARSWLRVETWNTGAIGHSFPNGPTDLIEVWLSIRATDMAGVVLVDQGSDGPQGAIRLGHRLLDARGEIVRDHRLWEVAQVVDLGRIPPEGTHTVDVPLSSSPSGAVEVEARWNYRRLDPAQVERLVGSVAEGLPILTVAAFRGSVG